MPDTEHCYSMAVTDFGGTLNVNGANGAGRGTIKMISMLNRIGSLCGAPEVRFCGDPNAEDSIFCDILVLNVLIVLRS